MRPVHECEWCGKRFEIFHLTDRFCSSKCRQKYWNAETAKAMGRRNLSMKQRNMPPEFVQGLDLSLEEFIPRQIEPKPSFAEKTWSDQWQCLYCGKHWPLSTVYCDCPKSDKAEDGDTDA